MAIRVNYSKDPQIARLQRKRDQQWELAGEARMQHDQEAEKKYMAKAAEFNAEIKELISEG